MKRIALPSLALTACWAVSAIGLIMMWQLLPTIISQAAVLILFIYSVISSYRGNVLISVYATAFIGLALFNYIQISYNLTPLIASLAIFGLVLLITWVKSSFHDNAVGRLEAILLAFFVSQVNSIVALWPVSFYNRALIVGLTFYLFWHIFQATSKETSPNMAKHFVFVAIVAILVLGGIIWANFPQLLTF